jgi:hypothetical protein
MLRFAAPVAILASLATIVGCGQPVSVTAPSAAAASEAAPAQASTGPTFELRLAPTQPEAGFTDNGPFVTDPNATTNSCQQLSDGFWKVDYSGGDPYIRVALLVGPEAVTSGPSEAVSGEIVIGSPLTTLLNFDQPGYRSGDAPGRSTAVVETTTGTDAITFDVAATTPRAKVDFSDYPYTVDVDLSVVCAAG